MTGELIAKAIKQEFEKVSDCPVHLYWIPPEETSRPYVCVGTINTDTSPYKQGFSEEIDMSFHFWSTRLDKRADASEVMEQLEDIARRIRIEGLSVCLTSSSRRIMTDTTTNTPYLHSVLFLDFLH